MEPGLLVQLSSPITKIKTIVYTQMEIKILRMNLGQDNCELFVQVFDATKENEKAFYYLLDGQEYKYWSSDEYVVNWVREKLKNELF